MTVSPGLEPLPFIAVGHFTDHASYPSGLILHPCHFHLSPKVRRVWDKMGGNSALCWHPHASVAQFILSGIVNRCEGTDGLYFTPYTPE